jgi:hypothetical protein
MLRRQALEQRQRQSQLRFAEPRQQVMQRLCRHRQPGCRPLLGHPQHRSRLESKRQHQNKRQQRNKRQHQGNL